MSKVIAILNVIAWAGFWSFGYLALSANIEAQGQVVTAVLLAALGGGIGLFTWVWLVRHSEETGYAEPSRSRSQPLSEEDAV